MIKAPEEYGYTFIGNAIPLMALAVAVGKSEGDQKFSNDELRSAVSYSSDLNKWEKFKLSKRRPVPAMPVTRLGKGTRTPVRTKVGNETEFQVAQPVQPEPTARDIEIINLLAKRARTTLDIEIEKMRATLRVSSRSVPLYSIRLETGIVSPLSNHLISANAGRWLDRETETYGQSAYLIVPVFETALIEKIIDDRKLPRPMLSEGDAWWRQQIAFPMVTWRKLPTKNTEQSTLGAQRGAPQKYDWEAMQIELMCRVYLGEIKASDTLTGVGGMMADWFLSSIGVEPSMKSIKDHVRPALTKLREADELSD